jgi:hypothetical protein
MSNVRNAPSDPKGHGTVAGVEYE